MLAHIPRSVSSQPVYYPLRSIVDYRAEMQRALGSGFAIEREIPGGGASLVFLAEEIALGRRVVVKMLPTKSGAVNTERFQREIAVASRLQHPHLVPLLTAGVVSNTGVPWFSMPYIEGESLRDLLVRRGPLPLGVAVRLMREIASALAYAHGRGVVHRDIKPDNVMLSDGVAMITDFGVAMAVNSAIADQPKSGRRLTGVGAALGTPAYSSPEQIDNAGSVDHRADIYAFGCVAYEILTGASPFAAHSMRDLLKAQLSEIPVPVSQNRVNLPPAIARIVMQCLEKSPDDRPQSASDIVKIVDGLTITSLTETGENPAVQSERVRTTASHQASHQASNTVTERPSRVPMLSVIFAITFILMVVVLVFS